MMPNRLFGRVIHENVLLTGRARAKLSQDRFFCHVGKYTRETWIPILRWVFFDRKPNAENKFETTRGPHFVQGLVQVGNFGITPTGKLFRVDGGLIYMTISRDIRFSARSEYVLDFHQEYYFYWAEVETLHQDLTSLRLG